jgi:predicted outer membrane repeat protein
MTVSDSTVIGNSAIYGGGIYTAAMLTITDSTITRNTATYGGGVFNTNPYFPIVGSVTVRDSAVTANQATQGAGIYNDASATLEVQGGTFSCNTASDSGGGIYNLGTATLLDCNLSKNTAGSAGGGIFNGASGSLTVKDSTVLNNVAPFGADIYNLGALTLDNSTVGVLGQ